MKTFQSYFLLLVAFVLLGTAQAQTPKKGWSNKAKGAVIGGGAGAVVGGVLGGGKGAVIGAAAGVVGGGLIGRNKDKKNDPARYNAYHKNK
ncbi:MAG: YMGG-like glycine zipper-containing protein [Bacteroidota bacterium]|nr:YMGG-like glycine zipper-containing protein [Bacteroidota bacterium]